MGDVLAVDWTKRKYLGKFEQPKTEQEELTRLAREIMGLATEQPFYESSVGYWAPEKDPA